MMVGDKARITGVKLLLGMISGLVGVITAAGLFDIIIVMFHIHAAHSLPASWRLIIWPIAIISLAIWVFYSVKAIRLRR